MIRSFIELLKELISSDAKEYERRQIRIIRNQLQSRLIQITIHETDDPKLWAKYHEYMAEVDILNTQDKLSDLNKKISDLEIQWIRR